jgi:hypothetical protein
MFVDRTALQWDLDPRKMTAEQLDVICDAMIKKASGGDPAIEAEINRLAQIEAGVTVVETTAEAVEP